MSTTAGEKCIRTIQGTRSIIAESNHSPLCSSTKISGTGESSARPKTRQKQCWNTKNRDQFLKAMSEKWGSVPNPNPSDSNSDDRKWEYFTEEQLEEKLWKKLEGLFNNGMNKLVSLGYDKGLALNAILNNAQCCMGEMDIPTNILLNSVAYLSSAGGKKGKPAFADFRELAKFSLNVMVSLLQDYKPDLVRGQVMLSLLMSDLHLAQARMLELPVFDLPKGMSFENIMHSEKAPSENASVISNRSSAKGTPASCSCCGSGNGEASEFSIDGGNLFLPEMALQREIACPKRFKRTQSLKSLLERNVAICAAGFRENYSKHFQSQSQSNSLSDWEDILNGDGTTSEVPISDKEESQYAKNLDVVNSMMAKFQELNLGGNSSRVQKDEMIVILMNQIKDLEKKVKERKEWAQEKAMQAAIKLSNELIELKTLRMEGRNARRLVNNGKQPLEDSTMKRLSEMENNLREACGHEDCAKSAVRKLETENEEIRAEIEAYKLNTSESETACLEIVKREKKYLKKILAGEKQKIKVQDNIADENGKISILQKELGEIEADTKTVEANWRQEQKLKELVIAQVVEEKHLKEASDANNRRNIEALKQKIDADYKHNKDDLQRVEQEYARLKESTKANKSKRIMVAHNGEFDGKLKDGRACMLCKKEEVSVVLLPCAHQIMCAGCSDNYGKKGKTVSCPYCRVPIQRRIRVYGATSS